MAQWYTISCAECGDDLRICDDCDKPPRFCKACRGQRAALWYDISCQEMWDDDSGAPRLGARAAILR